MTEGFNDGAFRRAPADVAEQLHSWYNDRKWEGRILH